MAYIVCTSNLDLVSFLVVPVLYSTLKLEIFPFTCKNYRGCCGICILPIHLEFSSYFQFQLILTFNDFKAQHMSTLSCMPNISLKYHLWPKL